MCTLSVNIRWKSFYTFVYCVGGYSVFCEFKRLLCSNVSSCLSWSCVNILQSTCLMYYIKSCLDKIYIRITKYKYNYVVHHRYTCMVLTRKYLKFERSDELFFRRWEEIVTCIVCYRLCRIWRRVVFLVVMKYLWNYKDIPKITSQNTTYYRRLVSQPYVSLYVVWDYVSRPHITFPK